MEDWKDKGEDKGGCPHGPGVRPDERPSQRGLKSEPGSLDGSDRAGRALPHPAVSALR